MIVRNLQSIYEPMKKGQISSYHRQMIKGSFLHHLRLRKYVLPAIFLSVIMVFIACDGVNNDGYIIEEPSLDGPTNLPR